MSVLKLAKEVLNKEADSIKKLACLLDKNFESAVKLILNCKGKVILTGMGKSGLIARKISASLSSTGTPSCFLHPAEAVHGDSGMIQRNDLIIAISHSGETEELLRIIPIIKTIGSKIISIVGNINSTLARESNLVLSIGTEKEIDSYNMVPTTSTTTLALGDALVFCLMRKRKFTREDFAFFHPGGSTGRMLLKVSDLMHTKEKNPIIRDDKFFKDALINITTKKLGVVSVINEENKLVGIITDGDVRRLLQKTEDSLARLFLTEIKEVMIKNPKTISPDSPAKDALKKMEDFAITSLPVVNKKNEPIGLIHIHDLIKAGFSLSR